MNVVHIIAQHSQPPHSRNYKPQIIPKHHSQQELVVLESNRDFFESSIHQ
jgi:hypothetical protein